MGTSMGISSGPNKRSMSSSEEVRANRSASPDFGKDLLTHEENSCLAILRWSPAICRDGLSGKTFPVFYRLTEDELLPPSFMGWRRSGIMRPGECLTLNIPEHPVFAGQCPSEGGVSSLLDILETGDLPQRYYLTPRAAAGVLRRADRRKKRLPEWLREALAEVAGRSEPIK
jgi:hypothetical protein